MTAPELIKQFSVVARTEYNKAYQDFSPAFSDLLYEYPSGPVHEMNFPFWKFLVGMEEFFGRRKHQTFPEGENFKVVNKEWDMAFDIPLKDLERAAGANSIQPLDIYRQRIAEAPRVVRNHPIELAFDMLVAGETNDFGTTFDGQNFFDTTHNYDVVAGTLSNIVTGTGTTEAQIVADFKTVKSRFASFNYQQGGDEGGAAQQRKLNRNNLSTTRFLIVAPDNLFGVFDDILTKDRLANGESNPMRGRFDLETLPFVDVNDWYVLLRDEVVFKPFLYQVEKVPQLDVPNPNDESIRERRTASWGAYGRYNVAYGSWWKAVKVTNV